MIEAVIQGAATIVAALITILPKVKTGIKSKVPWALVAVLLLALALSNLGVFTPSVAINYPKPGIEVRPDLNGYFPVVGTAKNINNKRAIWLITQYPSNPNRYFPGTREITDSIWYDPICLGKGPKRSVNAIVVSVLNSALLKDYATNAAQNGFDGLDKTVVEGIAGFKIEARVENFFVLETSGCK
jgi:hypothetical protein